MSQAGEFVFDINGKPFENHPFLDSSFSLDDTKTKIINAKVSLNEKVVSEHGKEWHASFMQHAIWANIDENETITSVKIEKIKATKTPTMNELISLLLQQENISEESLQELVLSGGDEQMGEPLDDSVMQSLLAKC